MEGLVIDFPKRSPSPVIEWESDEENKEPENKSLSATREVSQTSGKSKTRRESSKEKGEEGKSSKVPADDPDLASSLPSSPIIARKRPLFLQRLPLSGKRFPESVQGNKSPTLGNRSPTLRKSPVLRRRQKLDNPGTRPVLLSTYNQKESWTKAGGGAATIERYERCTRRGESRVLVGSSWIADLTRMEEAESGDCSQELIASWATEAPTGSARVVGGAVNKSEEEERKVQVRGAEVDTRLRGSSWIADLTHMEEEMESISQCSASIGSWEGEAKVQPIGEKTLSEIAGNFYEEGTEGEVEGISRSRSSKKALKGGLEEQLERALEWGRSRLFLFLPTIHPQT